MGDAVLTTDLACKVTYLNPTAERMTGWTSAEAWGRAVGEVMRIVDGATGEPCRSPVESALYRDTVASLAANMVLVRRDGLQAAVEDSAAPIHDREGNVIGAVIVFRPLSEARETTLRMSRWAHYDFLTGLPNRLLLRDRLTQAIALGARYGRRLAVLFVDLDRFKDVNDAAGHAIGDQVLQSVAERLLACVRSSDTVSRHGGDEFVIVLSEIDQERSWTPVANKILAAIATPYDLTPHVFRITASIGASLFPHDGRDGETLIQCADAAMYWAKHNGRNTMHLFDGRLKT